MSIICKNLFLLSAVMSVAIAVPAGAAASSDQPAQTSGVLAFPGAEGFGRFTRGGRGGAVIKVTNLEDAGPGSLRDAVEREGPRTVMFEVSGTISLEKELKIREGFVTIAGQTAPGDGITLRDFGMVIMANEVIVRYIRSRPGNDAGVETDAISIKSGKRIIIDHCSASWATDETLSVSPHEVASLALIDEVTVQWTIISESLNVSVHSKGAHGYGSLVRGSAGSRYSFHHNLWAHHEARMPRPGNYVDSGNDPQGPLFDFRNNVFYNWGRKASGYNADTRSISRYNFVNNYYLRGLDSGGALAFEESNPLARPHFSGNYMDHELPEHAWSLVRFKDGRGQGQDVPFAVAPVYTDPAPAAYRAVLSEAGASLSRDSTDARIVRQVRETSGNIIDDESEVGGWPLLVTGEPLKDTDGDGLPDAWERRHGLDPLDPGDGNGDSDGNGYTDLEDYINSLVTSGYLPSG